jgi:hypothetical protein
MRRGCWPVTSEDALARIGTARAIAALEDTRRLPLRQSAGEITSALETLRGRLG